MDESLRLSLLSPEKAARSGPSLSSRWTDYTFKRIHGDVVLRFWSIASEGGDEETIIFVQDVTQNKEAERARDQFLYHVTHELRTPLTNIRAYAETLSQDVIDDEQTIRECYNVIMGETQRLSRLVEDILNVSQLEVGTARLQASDLKLDKILRTVVQDQQGMADAKNIDLVLYMPSKTPTVRGDKDRLNVVFTNLIGNAIKYTLPGGRVDVRCAVENQRVRIAITDTGIGIDPADQDRIFDKFYRVDHPEVNAVPGTGLGLSIVQETLRVHGGTISVESKRGEGSTFTVTLPALSLDSGQEEAELTASVEET
jgi:two-component system phosphate regulon sensor histidine kinase PhoR